MTERWVTISKLDPHGRSLYSYPGEVLCEDHRTVVARCVWDLPRTVDLGPFTIGPGDTLIEHFYHEPYNIFAVHGHSGALKGWYCNVLAWTRFGPGTIGWADLALDLLVTPDGTQTVLDEEEFEALDPTPAQREHAYAALETLRGLARAGTPPFRYGPTPNV